MNIKDVDGVQVYPETDVNKLRAYWASLSVRQRNEFEKEVYPP